MKKAQICFYCGGKANSRQHIIPRSFYPDGMKNDLESVYSCQKHNYEARLLEERILLYFLGASNTKLAVSYATTKILPNLAHDKKKKLFDRLVNDVSADIKEILVKKEDLNNFIILLISALYYWKYQSILDRKILYIINKIRGEKFRYLKARYKFFWKSINKRFKSGYIGDPQVFKYRYFSYSNYICWELKFYKKVKILVVINTKIQYKKNI